MKRRRETLARKGEERRVERRGTKQRKRQSEEKKGKEKQVEMKTTKERRIEDTLFSTPSLS